MDPIQKAIEEIESRDPGDNSPYRTLLPSTVLSVVRWLEGTKGFQQPATLRTK
jgi:hypothetical protein